VQVNLGKLLTGLGSGELLHPQNSVLGATVSRAALYDSVQAENAALRSEVLELKKGQGAPQHQHQPPPPETPQQARSLFHEDYVSQLAQERNSRALELAQLQVEHGSCVCTLEHSHSIPMQKLQSEHDDKFSKHEQSHAVSLRAQHAAHQLALFEQHSILGLQHRQAEAALRAALEDRHTRQQQEARRDLINEIKENALHFVHGAPTYKALYSTGLARVDSSGNVMPGEQWHGCDGAHAQEADVDSPNSSLRDEDPFWLHQRVRKALHEQWTGFMQRCYAITGWDQHTTNHFSGAGGKAASIIAKMLRYNGPDGLAVPHGSIGFGSLLTAVLTSMPAHVMLLEESHKKTKSSLVAMLRKVVGPCAELDESLNGASQRKRRRERK
jgi:hypothetical protein